MVVGVGGWVGELGRGEGGGAASFTVVTQNNVIIGNILDSNLGNGLSCGGYGHLPGKYALGNIFASNTLLNNVGHDGGQANVGHGQVNATDAGETVCIIDSIGPLRSLGMSGWTTPSMERLQVGLVSQMGRQRTRMCPSFLREDQHSTESGNS